VSNLARETTAGLQTHAETIPLTTAITPPPVANKSQSKTNKAPTPENEIAPSVDSNSPVVVEVAGPSSIQDALAFIKKSRDNLPFFAASKSDTPLDLKPQTIQVVNAFIPSIQPPVFESAAHLSLDHLVKADSPPITVFARQDSIVSLANSNQPLSEKEGSVKSVGQRSLEEVQPVNDDLLIDRGNEYVSNRDEIDATSMTSSSGEPLNQEILAVLQEPQQGVSEFQADPELQKYIDQVKAARSQVSAFL
jgi:hypothetical protein